MRKVSLSSLLHHANEGVASGAPTCPPTKKQKMNQQEGEDVAREKPSFEQQIDQFPASQPPQPTKYSPLPAYPLPIPRTAPTTASGEVPPKRLRTDSEGASADALSALVSLKGTPPSRHHSSSEATFVAEAAAANERRTTPRAPVPTFKPDGTPASTIAAPRGEVIHPAPPLPRRIVRSVSEPGPAKITAPTAQAPASDLFRYPVDFAAGRALRQKVLLPLLPHASAADARLLGMFFRGEVVVIPSAPPPADGHGPRGRPPPLSISARMARIAPARPSDVRSILPWYEMGDSLLSHATEGWHREWMGRIICPGDGHEILKLTLLHDGTDASDEGDEIVGLVHFERVAPEANGDIRTTAIRDIRVHPDCNVEVSRRARSYRGHDAPCRDLQRVRKGLRYHDVASTLVAAVVMRGLLCETAGVSFRSPKADHMEECATRIMGPYRHADGDGNKYFALERDERWDLVRSQFAVVHGCLVGAAATLLPQVPGSVLVPPTGAAHPPVTELSPYTLHQNEEGILVGGNYGTAATMQANDSIPPHSIVGMRDGASVANLGSSCSMTNLPVTTKNFNNSAVHGTIPPRCYSNRESILMNKANGQRVCSDGDVTLDGGSAAGQEHKEGLPVAMERGPGSERNIGKTPSSPSRKRAQIPVC
eukprot:CAMPEP_0194282920 /NCGR_PEP_ID=MMETSP0169-20130528/24242_1 /TAXON_ID=218684 /ORGANISM="Corethron pennatum, Strain L29A3" /LENGTH=650 /DNA_ID=CAMNT_0039028387 /DNA_START=136 /DNA_END=2088 /DNA_ORIENTATION=+